MDYPIEAYKAQAAAAFSRLLTTFETWTNGWQVGNAFDTMTDYVLRYPDSEPSPNAVVKAALDRWEQVQSSMCWYDDYGWWGIASAKAFDDRFADVFGVYREQFQSIATGCWNVTHTGKPDQGPYKYLGGPMVWENRDEGDEPGYFTSAAGWAGPRFAGGVWQYDLFYGERPGPPECTPNHLPDDVHRKLSDPRSGYCPLGPFQNTVMNGLYLELALRLAMHNQGNATLAAAETELEFLHNWFGVAGDGSLLQGFSDGTLLVRERVSTYAELGGIYPLVEGFATNSIWCGDQGLILGGLVDRVLVDPNNPADPTDQTRAIAIAKGVLLHLVDDCGVMPSSDGFDNHGDPDDYSCGSGVFWRYLLHGFDQNSALRAELLSLVADDPHGNAVYVSAAMALAPECASDNALFVDFNVVASLLAAIGILENATGSGVLE
jgi:hypothetical protein